MQTLEKAQRKARVGVQLTETMIYSVLQCCFNLCPGFPHCQSKDLRSALCHLLKIL